MSGKKMLQKTVQIGNKLVGEGQPCYVIAEIGINHNGDMAIAEKLIRESHRAGVDAVKLQKRTIDVVYSQEELAKPRESVFGDTNGDLKRGLELNDAAHLMLSVECQMIDIDLIYSCWDENSVDSVNHLERPAYKIASASLTDDELLKKTRATGKPIILSTGMSTLAQIDHAVDVLGDDDLIILHCTSTYPTAIEELNLNCIPMLKERYQVPIGYSGHEHGLATTVAAVALGACMVERHITLDRSMWGSDQSASLEPKVFTRLVEQIHTVEKAMGNGEKVVYETERPIIEKLRRVDDTTFPQLSAPYPGLYPDSMRMTGPKVRELGPNEFEVTYSMETKPKDAT